MKKLGEFLKYFLAIAFCLFGGIAVVLNVLLSILEKATPTEVGITLILLFAGIFAAILTFVE